MIHMIGDLGVPCLCEGCETEDQHDFLKKTGCRYIQGYYFGKPQPRDF